MSYEARRQDYEKEHIYIVEMALSKPGETDSWRFCSPRSPHPPGIDAIPILESVSTTPSEIDLKGGLGKRASVSMRFTDFTGEGGTFFWPVVRARFPNYQNQEIKLLSGYLVNGVFDAANFQTRYYVIDTLNATQGQCTITAKDPLKLAGLDKAQAPVPNTGELSAAITAAATSATLQPPGVGNSEYATSGYLLIGDEVCSFTRSGDTLTLVRGRYNTTASDHDAEATVQQCLVYEPQRVDEIVSDLLLNYTNVNAAYIDLAAWQLEAQTYLPNLIEGIVVSPEDVNKLLKELSESMPHYLFWDERIQGVEFTAIKAPPDGANALNSDSNFLSDSFSTRDKPEMRVSTVFVHFGQFNPTRPLKEVSNYLQTYVRTDSDSVVNYNSNKIKTVFSRWISFLNSASARRMAALVGRRFSDVPREVKFSLDSKDAQVWTGQTRAVLHRDIVNALGQQEETLFQILSTKQQADNFEYRGLEYRYGPPLDQDEGGGEPGSNTVIIAADATNILMRTLYESQYGTATGSTVALFVIEAGTVVGSTTNTLPAMDTQSWPVGAQVTLEIKSSAFIVGRGGDGGYWTPTPISYVDAENGGLALKLNNDITIVNGGVIGGGGGGGAGVQPILSSALLSGGGGAGSLPGAINPSNPGALPLTEAEPGTTSSGGNGAKEGSDFAGTGGDLAQAGIPGSFPISPPGAAGDAIDKNGFTLSGSIGDVRGAILT